MRRQPPTPHPSRLHRPRPRTPGPGTPGPRPLAPPGTGARPSAWLEWFEHGLSRLSQFEATKGTRKWRPLLRDRGCHQGDKEGKEGTSESSSFVGFQPRSDCFLTYTCTCTHPPPQAPYSLPPPRPHDPSVPAVPLCPRGRGAARRGTRGVPGRRLCMIHGLTLPDLTKN